MVAVQFSHGPCEGLESGHRGRELRDGHRGERDGKITRDQAAQPGGKDQLAPLIVADSEHGMHESLHGAGSSRLGQK